MEESQNITIKTGGSWYVILFVLLIGLVGGYFVKGAIRRCPEVELLKTDTVEVRETVTVITPPEVRYETLRERILVQVRDTVTVRDTLFVRLPLEKRTYKRDDFYAEVTGYDPRLTYIEVYPKTKIVTNTERVSYRNELSFGFDVGYLGRFYAPIYLRYSRMLRKHIDLNASVVYDLTQKSYGAEVGLEFGFGW